MGLSPIRALQLSTVGILAALIVSSCAPRNTSYASLANQGLIPVSIDSPFVGANLYLAKEMEDSLYLYNFLRSRGSPRAIEIVGDSEESAELSLFYPAKLEIYRATPQRDSLTKAKEWIIRGPYAIDRSQFRQMTSLGQETTGTFEIFGRREVLGAPTHGAEVRVIAPAFVPTPHPTPKPRKRVVKKTTPSTEQAGPAIAIQGTPMNFDQQALIEASRPAPTLAPNTGTPAATSVPSGAAKGNGSTSLDEALKNTVNIPPSAGSSGDKSTPSAAKPRSPAKDQAH